MALILTGSSGSTTLDSSAGLTFSDSSNQQYAASPYVLKNRLINGSMLIDQRNNGASTTATTSALTYVIDRWAIYTAGSNVTCQQVAGPNTYDKAEQLLPLTGNTATVIYQRIESKNCLDLPNKTVTVSGQIYIDSISGVTCTVSGFAATSTDSGYLTGLTGFSVSLVAGSYVSFSGQISLPSTAYNGIELDIGFGGVAGRTIKITNVQLELGTTATPFERRLYNQELANCQRYLPSSGITSNYYAGVSTSTTNAYAPIPLPVPARVAPTGITIASGTYYWLNGSGTQNTATVVFNSAGYQGAMVQITTTGATLGQAGLFNPNGATILFTGCEL